MYNNIDLTKYYFDSEDWDCPSIVDDNFNERYRLYVSEDMYSFVVLNGKVYTAYEKSHNGAILNALLSIHHLDNEEQLERKFKTDIDMLCGEVRYKNVEAEGRFWCGLKLLQNTGNSKLTKDIINQLSKIVSVNPGEMYIVGKYNSETDLNQIVHLNNYLMESKKKKILQESNNGLKITPTIEWMKQHYEKANRELFHGALGECYFEAKPITSHSRWLGMFSMKVSNLRAERYGRRMYIEPNRFNPYDTVSSKTYITKENFVELCKPTITLNTMYIGTEFSLYLTLVHEMCHYFTYMYGYCPKQAHGVEFREIGTTVSYRSNGVITVQRLASAEAMEGYEVTDEIKQKREKQAKNRIIKSNYYLVVQPNNGLRLVNLASEEAADGLYMKSKARGDKVIPIKEPEVKEQLYNMGYRQANRIYRSYWEIKPTSKAYTLLKGII